MSEELNVNVNENVNVEETNAEPKTYTEEEVAMLLQKEGDRRVSQALKKAEAKYAKQASEAEKLSKMSKADQETYKLQQRIAELEAKERDFVLAENKNALSKALSERGLPVTFCDYLVSEDSDQMMENLKEFEKAWRSALNDTVAQKIGSNSKTPQTNMVQQRGLTQEQFDKMTIQQQSELYRTNRELYMEMVNR